MKDPKTTAAGVFTIGAAVFGFVGAWLNGHPPDAASWAALTAAVSMGWGLIKAADAQPPAK